MQVNWMAMLRIALVVAFFATVLAFAFEEDEPQQVPVPIVGG